MTTSTSSPRAVASSLLPLVTTMSSRCSPVTVTLPEAVETRTVARPGATTASSTTS